MAKGFSFEEALQPVEQKGFSFEEALQPKPEPTLSPEEQMMSSSVGQVTPQDPNAPSLLAGTTLPANAPAPTGRSIQEVAAGPDVSAVPKMDVSKMPTAEERATAQFGITPEMGLAEKALRTGKSSLYGAATGLEQTWLGGARMISDLTGMGKEGVEGVSKQLSKEQQAVEKTFAPEYGLKIAKDIGSSVIQNIPIIATGVYAGQAGALTNMFTQSFMQTYDDSRNEGLGIGASTARSAIFGTAEALGESLGLPSLLKGVKDVMKGVPTAELAKDVAKYIMKEIPGEQLTYVTQFLADKGFNLNPEAGMKEFLQGVQDTALVTVGQTAVMGGAGFATNKVLKELRDLHSKGEEGIPKAADMMKQAGFTFEQAKQPVTPPPVTPTEAITPAPAAPAAVTPQEAPPAAPTPIGAGEFEEPTPEAVTPVTPEPVAADKTKKSPFVSSTPYQITTEDAGTFQVQMSRLPDGSAVIFDPDGNNIEIKSEFAKNKTDEELFKYYYEPLGYEKSSELTPESKKKATKAEEVVQEPVQVEELTIPVVDKDKKPTGETDVIDPKTLYVDSGEVFAEGKNWGFSLDDLKRDLPESPAKTALLEKADKLLDDFYKTVPGLKVPSKPSFYLRSRSSAKNIPSLGTDAVLDSTNPEVIKNVKDILKDYEVESGQSQEGNYLDAVDRDLRNNKEEIKAPPISKNSVVPTATIDISPYDGGFLASSSYNGKGQGYGVPLSVFGKLYKTRQEAIDAEANRIRKYAQEDKNTTALKWLDSVSKPTKEAQVEINKARQAEKKAKAAPAKKKEKPVEKEVKKAEKVLTGTNLVEMFVPEQYQKTAQEYVDANADLDKAFVEMNKIKDKNKRQQFTNDVLGPKASALDAIGKKLPTEIVLFLYKGMATKSLKEQQSLIADYEKHLAPSKGKKAEKEVKAKPAETKKAKAIPKLDEKWAEGKKELTSKPSSMDQEVYEQLQDLQKGNFAFTKASFTGANALARENATNKERKSIYDKAAREFLSRQILPKPPTKNQPKIEIEDAAVSPYPLDKKIKAVTTLDEQKKAMMTVAAPKDEYREMLKGIMVEPDKLVVTDGHRMAMYDTKTGVTEKTLLDKEGKVIDAQYPPYERIIDKAKGAKMYGMVNATAIGNYARGTRNAYRYISADKNSPFSIQFKNGEKVIPYNGRYIEDMANMFRQFGYEGFEIGYNDNGMLVAKSPDGKLTQYVMGMRDVDWNFQPFNVENNEPGTTGIETEPMKTQPSIDLYPKKSIKQRTQEIHDEKISEYSRLRQRVAHLTRKVAEGKVSLGLQRELNDLLELTKELKQDVKLTTPKNMSPENFMERALKEYNKENITKDVLDVVKYFYDNNPSILNGIKLSVRQTQEEGVMGNFAPLQRIVTLYKGLGAESPGTARHEIMHSLEQMMNSETRQAVIDSWEGALKNAITQYGADERSSAYFHAVLDFINNPTDDNFKRATKLMPSKDFYQYMNPSEYWAVNAEKLMAAQMGTAWAKFVRFVKGLGERLKAMFGLENDHAIHKAFKELMKGEKKRMDKESLTSYLNASAANFDFLNDIKDVDDLLEKHNRPDTPLHPSGEVKDTIMGSYQKSKKIATKMAENPLLAVNNMTGKLDRAVTYARNKNVWYGSGLDQADFAKYNGELKNSQGLALASVAVTNAIHAGHVATQVMIQGKLIFDPKTQMFRADKSNKSLANVVRLKHDLEEKLGNQRAANVVNAYFEAKRSRSIVNEYLTREADYEAAIEAGEDEAEAAKNLKSIEIAIQKVNMDDEAIDDFIALEKDYPELRKMMDNWTAVNQNMLDMMEFAGVISKKRAEHLRSIKDYVPWYRIMDDQTDIHMPAGVRGMTNVGQEKKFKAGEVDRDIDDIVDNMIHNVMMMTRNSMKNYANNRIAMEYATRNEKGKIKLYPTEGKDEKGVRVNLIANGRRVIVNIPDPLIAEASLGMENIEIPMIDILAVFANGLRRGITTFPVFQVSQLFMDAPTAAWVSGVKNPAAVWAGTFGSFIRALKPHDPIVDMLKSYGIGGYQSSARTPEKEMKLEIGLLDKSAWAKGMKALDHIGDASDYAQRRAVYKQVLKETGDEMQALVQANNVIDFLKRGSGKPAQFVTRTVSFMNAYAQSIDVLATALAGGGLKGKSRKAAQAQMIKTGLLLAGTTLLYCMAVGADDDYDKLDDQTKIRNIIIPGTGIRLPMHTSASFFFKAIPELIYNKVTKEGTKNQVDWTRLKKALGEAAVDSLLGPNMIPTGVKPVAEIALNHNFFTGGTLTPKGMEKLESFRQYNSSTSELGKVISGLTMGALNPIESDHLVRGLFGTAGAAVMYASNLFSGDRVAPQAKDNPLYGSFVLPEVPRGREDLFYDLKERSDKKYETFVDMMKKQHGKEAQEYRSENKGLIAAHGFVTQADADLKRINAEIRRLSDLPADKMSSAEKRARITKFQEQKNRILERTIDFRLKADL